MMPGRAQGFGYGALLLFLGVCAGCEEPFQPIQESDRYFSIHGLLDAAADTQWVRVTPLRTRIGTVPGPIDAVVTLEHLETGTTVTLSDSLFQFRPLHGGVDAEHYAHNFSTTEPLELGGTYRLTATRSDGASSSATVTIPDQHAEVVPEGGTRIRVHGVPHLAMVLDMWEIPPECGHPARYHSEYQLIVREATSTEDYHVVQIGWFSAARPSFLADPPDCPVPLGPRHIAVVASGAPWPYDSMLLYREVTHPNVAGNVENGVGFLAGLLTTRYALTVSGVATWGDH